MSAHTPTPWAQHEDEPRVIVAAAAPTMSLLGLDSHDTAVIWSAEDAALIVHRVNVHDELLAALKRMVNEATHATLTDHFPKTTPLEDAVAAIAHAEPRKVMTQKEHA